MTTQAFIEKIPEEIRLHPLGHCKSLSELVLDPEVWKAVGKVEGWRNDRKYKGTRPVVDFIPEWQQNMIAMTQARIDGKTIEEFLATL